MTGQTLRSCAVEGESVLAEGVKIDYKYYFIVSIFNHILTVSIRWPILIVLAIVVSEPIHISMGLY